MLVGANQAQDVSRDCTDAEALTVDCTSIEECLVITSVDETPRCVPI
jgi:hypothetical protein